MKLAFILTMPGVGSWNGRWSGEGKLYAVVRKAADSKAGRERVERILKGAPYRYRWSDGWMASIEVRVVDAREGTRLAKASRGFCGYEWMVDSIWWYQHIYADHEKPEGLMMS